MTDVLIFADTVRSPEMRHEVPLAVPDPFLYVERNGSRHVVVSSLEVPRLRELDGLETAPLESFGRDELVAAGLSSDEIWNEIVVRACREYGVEHATVPFWFPVELADHLRQNGLEVSGDRLFFDRRRRVKSEAELAGIRRAQEAAQAGMSAARTLLHQAVPDGDIVMLEGAPLTVERVKLEIEQVFLAHGTYADEFIVAHGAQAAVGHESGSGVIAANAPIVIDIWPRDRESGCYADMTRTFVVGEVPAELREWHALCHEALERSLAAIRPGVTGRAVYDVACDVFEERGHATGRTKQPGEVLEHGFFHGLGHGVGLEVHEDPGLGLTGHEQLVAGDVVTSEPGLYRPGFGGCRLEDLVLVTETGAENLTDFPYDLEP